MKTKTNAPTGHTPGPWRSEVGGEPATTWLPIYAGKKEIAAVLPRHFKDAVLIASAPKLKADRDALLAAAKQAMRLFPEQMRGSTLEAAIAQAEAR